MAKAEVFCALSIYFASMYSLLRFVPKNYLSWCFGKFARSAISRPFIRPFAAYFRIDLRESAKPISQFATLLDFFVRELHPGSRPLGSDAVSPVDGTVAAFGAIENGMLVQAKGKTYTVGALLGDHALAERFLHGYFVTLYLAPCDYHRVHAPVSGKIVRALYIQGYLWPVNRWSVENIAHLFSINERVISLIESVLGLVAVVKVGATNVGSIALRYDALVTNVCPHTSRPGAIAYDRTYDPAIPLRIGEEIGVFQLGSTVILLFESGKFVPRDDLCLGPIKMGQSLGRIAQ